MGLTNWSADWTGCKRMDNGQWIMVLDNGQWIMDIQKSLPKFPSEGFWLKEAITYSPTLYRSTIGASGLNFSVRDGKRWNPAAIVTWISCVITNYEIRITNAELYKSTCKYLKKNLWQRLVFIAPVSKLHYQRCFCFVFWTHFCARESFRVISTARLKTLPSLHLRPINAVFFGVPVRKTNLGAGFALRCFQRLS